MAASAFALLGTQFGPLLWRCCDAELAVLVHARASPESKDPWGERLRFLSGGLTAGWWYSTGPNKRDESGEGDDVVLENQRKYLYYDVAPEILLQVVGALAGVVVAAALTPPFRSSRRELGFCGVLALIFTLVVFVPVSHFDQAVGWADLAWIHVLSVRPTILICASMGWTTFLSIFFVRRQSRGETSPSER